MYQYLQFVQVLKAPRKKTISRLGQYVVLLTNRKKPPQERAWSMVGDWYVPDAN